MLLLRLGIISIHTQLLDRMVRYFLALLLCLFFCGPRQTWADPKPKQSDRPSSSQVKRPRKSLPKKKAKRRKASRKRAKKKRRRKGKKSRRSEASLSLTQLRKAYEKELKKEGLKGAKVGWSLLRLDNGEVLSSHRADELFHPASCTKLVTTASAYRVLGPDGRFVTRWYLGPRKGQEPPDLYWYASGDPKLVPEVFETVATQIKNELSQAGLPMKLGSLIIDDTDFTKQVLAPGYDQKPDDDAAYRSPNGGAGFQFNRFSVSFRPGKRVGDRPLVTLSPPLDYFKIENTAKTKKRGKEQLSLKASPSASDDTMTLRIGGSIPRRHRSVSVRRRIAHPLQFAGQSLLHYLDKVGVSSRGKVRRGRLIDDAQLLVTHKSPPMSSLIKDVNVYSNNYMAEQLLLAMGLKVRGFGGWEEGLLVMKSLLDAEVGISGYKMTNGSGLFGQTAFSPHMLTSVLRYAHLQTSGRFRFLLPEAGKEGTLKKRLRVLPREAFRAKTGTLDRVSTLCGYLKTRQKVDLALCLLMNDYPAKTWAIRSIQDEMVRFAWLLELPVDKGSQ